MNETNEKITVSHRIPLDLNRWLTAFAARTGTTKSKVLALALDRLRKEDEAATESEAA